MTTLNTDYLVIGAGAMGMAFTDVLMTESDATVTIVDRYHQPGGHWNVAYPFVRLHQPSIFYGLNSRQLGSDTIDTVGWNKGLYELAGQGEILAYFDTAMRDYVSSGRVRYLPMCEYRGDQQVTSLVSGESHCVVADKIVDATYMNVTVPAMASPSYEVAQGAQCVALNALTRISDQWQHYVVVGAGKTGMDACLFLLEHGVNPDHISWIKPRESWLLDRAQIQSGDLFETSFRPHTLAQFRAVAESDCIEDVFARSCAKGILLRVDENIKPTMYRCATVTQSEVEQLRRIKNVIRLGRVQRIEPGRVVLDEGSFSTVPGTLHVDCTADGLERRPPQPVFSGEKITLQSVRTCQQVFSAAFIAHIELVAQDNDRKNQLCTPVPHPDSDIDYLSSLLADIINGALWVEDEALTAWLKAARLDGFTYSKSSRESDEDFMQCVQPLAAAAAEKLFGYLAGGTAS